MGQQQKKQAQFSGAYILIALLQVESLDRTDIERLVSGPAPAAAEA
jgi:hypothetical protein